MRFHGSYKDGDIDFHCLIDEKPDPSAFVMHTHEECEIFCFFSGRGIYRIEGSEYILEPGDILIMSPAEAHYVTPDPAIPYERMSLHFRKNLLESLDPEGILLTPFFSRSPGRANLYRDRDFPDQNHRFYINAMLGPCADRRLQILTNLIPFLNSLYLASLRRNAGSSAPEDTPMHRVLRYINDNLTTDLSLDSLCERFFTSKSQLCRSFKQSTGASVSRYITIKRLICARNMILDGTPSTRACTASGFNDYSAFYRAYKKQFSKSPCEDHCRNHFQP
ncbi:MAG: helix-turn-helix transcriptional regulator [Clostridia bacterium]|nr:helix-turn-helix transcriptional regulator [Clostridia bacterium]